MPPSIPEGFEPHFRKSPLTDPWEPLYSRRELDSVILGFVAGDQHTNSRGFVHGGLLTALADNAMGLSCAVQLENPGLVTLSLGIDFLSSAQRDQWVEIRTTFTKVGKSVCFAQCFVHADGKAVARANATFAVRS
jgi:uncharacterized protein (TIGR00369 family)